MKAQVYALIGLGLALPFAIANTIAVNELMPAYAWLAGLGPHIIFGILALGFVGGIVALVPLFKKGADGKQKFYLLNAIVGIGLLVFFAVVGFALGEEIYRCDILKIPNCD